MGKPVLTFDTTVHNRLVDDGAASEPIYAALKISYFMRLAGLALEEIMATPDAAERRALLRGFGRLRHGAYDCLLPQNELLRRLIAANEADSQRFDWRKVIVSSEEYARAVDNPDFVADDQLAADQRRNLNEQKKAFEQPFSSLRPKLEEIFERHGENQPLNFRDVLPRVQGEGGLVVGFGKGLYTAGGGSERSEEEIRKFIDACPPFRAVIYSYLLAWYDRSAGDRHQREKFKAGRLDLFMAVYLPYCDEFVTAEIKGEQERCLREISYAGKLGTSVVSYDAFCDRLLISV